MLWSDVLGDWCHHNDTSILSTYVFPNYTNNAEDFEPEHSPSFPPRGWAISNRGDTSTWHRAGPGDRRAHTGAYYATCASTSRTDDWLIMHGLLPGPGTADTIGAFLTVPYSWCFLQVWALACQDPSDPIELLLDTVIKEPGWHDLRISLDGLDGQTVYVAFRHYDGTSGPLCLDDVWFTSERAIGLAEPPSGCRPALELRLLQNPVAGDQVNMSYQTPHQMPFLVEAIDALGRTVARQYLPVAPASGQVRIATSGWPAGAYFFRIRAGTASASVKCIVHGGAGEVAD